MSISYPARIQNMVTKLLAIPLHSPVTSASAPPPLLLLISSLARPFMLHKHISSAGQAKPEHVNDAKLSICNILEVKGHT